MKNSQHNAHDAARKLGLDLYKTGYEANAIFVSYESANEYIWNNIITNQ